MSFHPSHLPRSKVEIFQVSLYCYLKGYFTIPLMYEKRILLNSLKSYYCFPFKNGLEPSGLKTNGSIFQIPNSPSNRAIWILNLAKSCWKNPKTSQTTLISGEKGFLAEKEIFYFVLNVLSKTVVYEWIYSSHLEISWDEKQFMY